MPNHISITNGPAVVGRGSVAQFRIVCWVELGADALRLPLAVLIDRFNARWAKLGRPQRVRPA